MPNTSNNSSSEESLPDISSLYTPTTLTYFGKNSRSILLSGEITEEVGNAISSQLLELDSISDSPIQLFINTPGGDVTSAFMIYDALQIITSPVNGIVSGACLSAGLFILQGCHERAAFTNASFMYHETICSLYADTVRSLQSSANFLVNRMNVINDIIKKRSKINKKLWDSIFTHHTGHYFDAQQALEYKLLDTIIQKRTKI